MNLCIITLESIGLSPSSKGVGTSIEELNPSDVTVKEINFCV